MYSLYKNLQQKNQTDKTDAKQQQTQMRTVKIKRDQCIFQKILSLSGQQSQKIYIKQGFLGRGGFANCYITQQIGSDKQMATKIIAKSNLVSNRSKLRLMNEIKIHKAFRHENIVEFFHYFEDSENVYIMLQLCQNQSLNQLIRQRGSFTTPEIQSFIFGICNGVKYLHSKKYIHRDLKLGNIFLNSNFQIKIGDFGLTSQLQFLKQNKRTVCGTPNYIAPQVLEGTGYYFQVDIWSIGIILYTLYYGFPPFQSDLTPDIYTKIRNCQYFFPKSMPIPHEAVTLIRQILITDPTKRPSLEDILSSPFMKLGKNGIPLTLPEACYQRPPTQKQLDQMQHYILPQIPQESNCMKSCDKQKHQYSTQDCTLIRSDFQQKTSCANLPSSILKGTESKNQTQKSIGQNLQINKTNMMQHNSPDIYIQQFQNITQGSYYFCTSTFVLGVYTKDQQIAFRHISSFSNVSDNKIFQIKLYNNLFSEKVQIKYSQYKNKAVLNLKAKQLLKNYKITQNEKQSNTLSNTNKIKNKPHHQRCASNPNFLKSTGVSMGVAMDDCVLYKQRLLNNGGINSGHQQMNNATNRLFSTNTNKQQQNSSNNTSIVSPLMRTQIISPLSTATTLVNSTTVTGKLPETSQNLHFISKISINHKIGMIRLSNKNIQIVFMDSNDGFVIEHKTANVFYYANMEAIAKQVYVGHNGGNTGNSGNNIGNSGDSKSVNKICTFYQVDYNGLKQIVSNWQNNNIAGQQNSKVPNVLMTLPLKSAQSPPPQQLQQIINTNKQNSNNTNLNNHRRIKSSMIEQQQHYTSINNKSTNKNNSKNSRHKYKNKNKAGIRISMIKIKYIVGLIKQINTKRNTNKHTKNRHSQ